MMWITRMLAQESDGLRGLLELLPLLVIMILYAISGLIKNRQSESGSKRYPRIPSADEHEESEGSPKRLVRSDLPYARRLQQAPGGGRTTVPTAKRTGTAQPVEGTRSSQGSRQVERGQGVTRQPSSRPRPTPEQIAAYRARQQEKARMAAQRKEAAERMRAEKQRRQRSEKKERSQVSEMINEREAILERMRQTREKQAKRTTATLSTESMSSVRRSETTEIPAALTGEKGRTKRSPAVERVLQWPWHDKDKFKEALLLTEILSPPLGQRKSASIPGLNFD